MNAIQSFLQIRPNHLLIVVATDFSFEMEIVVDEFFTYFDKGLVAQLALRALEDHLETPHCTGVFIQENVVLPMEFIHYVLDEQLVKVVAAELRIAVAGFDFDYAGFDHDDRDIKGAAAKVIYKNPFVTAMAGLVRKHGSSRFVNDADHFEIRKRTGVLGGLSLIFVEERRDRYYGFPDRLAEELFGFHFKPAENER